MGSYLVKGKKKNNATSSPQNAYVQGVYDSNRRPEVIGYFKAGTPPITKEKQTPKSVFLNKTQDTYKYLVSRTKRKERKRVTQGKTKVNVVV